MAIARKGVRLAKYSEALSLNPTGRKKLRCPSCGALSFVPYIFEDSGEPVGLEECGRCDHAESCGYHLTPAQYFQRYPERRPNNGMSKEERRAEWEQRRAILRHEQQLMDRRRLIAEIQGQDIATEGTETPVEKGGRLPWSLIPPTEERAENTAFFRFLCRHFEPDTVRHVFRLYHVGGDRQGRAVFWQIDQGGEIRTGKVMKYQENGHRAKNEDGTPAPGATDWAHAILKRAGRLPDGWRLEQCLFGAHLLRCDDMPAPVCLVEAEKTAIIAACALPQYVWIATGGKYNLKRATLAPLRDYVAAAGPVTVFADLGSRDDWAARLEPFGLWLPYTLSDYLEDRATPEARARGLDLADYLTGEF